MNNTPLPKALKSETRISRHLYLFDVLFVLLFFSIMWLFAPLVYGGIKVFYFIFVLGLGIVLTWPSGTNPKKRRFQALYYWLIRDRVVYRPVSMNKYERG